MTFSPFTYVITSDPPPFDVRDVKEGINVSLFKDKYSAASSTAAPEHFVMLHGSYGSSDSN